MVIVTILIVIAIGLFSLVNILFYSMTILPTGDYLSESTSPNGTYTIKTYLCNGGATVAYAVRGELITNTKNFKKKNVTMLEFLDFYESYKQNVLQLNKLRFNKMSALEQLNFSVGKTIFNP